MDISSASVCIRCGKQRVIVSVKEEAVGNSIVTYTETACPDPMCQKKVDGILAVEQEKRHQSFLLREQKLSSRKQVKNSN